MTMTTSAVNGSHATRAREAWALLPHGGRDLVRMQVQCAHGHHLAKVYDTDAGLVVATTLRARSHGRRDRPDQPHTPAPMPEFFDLLDEGTGDIPAWCVCGHRTLARPELQTWLSAGDKRVIVD
jgi:hypothetical protein